jgi:serine carboxypeptidase-like clade 2
MLEEKGNLDLYGLDFPICNDPVGRLGRTERTWAINAMIEEMKHLYGMKDHHVVELKKGIKGLQSTTNYEPCTDDYMTSYLRQDSVKEAIHVKKDILWKECRNWNDHKTQPTDMTSFYNYLIDGKFGLNMLVYSGDDDFVCSTYGTQSWIWDLGYKVAPGKEWQEYTVNNQTAGYITKWKGTKLGLATVRGAGHMVPAYKPEIALELFGRFLRGELTDE